jgi:hypothetical protein
MDARRTCKLRSHQFGWELLLFVGGQVEIGCRRKCAAQQDEVLTTGEQWKAAMIDKGWQ